VLIGGVAKPDILERVEREHGLEVEWAALNGRNAEAHRVVLRRIRSKRVGAVVVLEGLVGHSLTVPLIHACKVAETPFAYGGRAGSEQLRGAFGQLELALAAALGRG